MAAILSKSDVAEIKQLIADDQLSKAEIGKRYGVSRSIISDIATERRHKDVSWPEGYRKRKKKGGGQRKPVPKYDPDNDRIKELEAEVAHLTDERNFHRRAAKAASKTQGLYQAAVEVVKERVRPFKGLPRPRVQKKSPEIQEDLVIHLSDGHHDQIVTLEETGGLEQYNFEISCARAEKLVATVIEHSQEHLPNYNFETLWILANGDHTSGEIHGHEKRSYFKNQMKNTLAIGQLHALMIRDLAPYFENVNCVYVPGNHGRRTTKKDHYGAHENWDYLVAKVAELWLRDVENVNFLIPNAFSVNLEIRGHGFNMSHGDDVRGSLGIPFYGMVRKQKNLMALNNITGGTRIRYFCMGHHHVAASMADLDGELLVNGAWLGNDPFSYNTFAGYRAPVQLMHGVHHKQGVTWRMPINLKHEGERDGPKRYIVEI